MEAEYIGISASLREAIPIMELLEEMKSKGFDVSAEPTIKCRIFEDNSGAVEMVKTDKYRPRTKHINIKYHHFCQYVKSGCISISRVRTDKQPADMLTKPLPLETLETFRKWIMGW